MIQNKPFRCTIHGWDAVKSDLIVGEWLCPACRLNKQPHIERTKLGTSIGLALPDGTNANLINNKISHIMVGDQYEHRTHGVGIITRISSDNTCKHPIKMHFKDAHVYCYFGINGLQYDNQEIPEIDFPHTRTKCGCTDVGGFSTDKVAEAFRAFGVVCSGKTSVGKWDGRLISLAEHVAAWSKDPSTKVGAVIVDGQNRIISIGFNGYPQGISDDDLHDRESKYAKVLHAEKNALLFAMRDLTECSIYVWPMAPCSQCMAAIIQTGITRVVTIKPTKELEERWGAKIKITEDMADQAGVEIEYLP